MLATAAFTGSTVSATGRVVLLGASNLVRGLATVLTAARARLPGPLDVLAAHGHGRSLGHRAWFFGRELPPIRDCGLWEALAGRPPLPTWALFTDAGNDLGYGHPPEEILADAAVVLERLAAAGARTVVTGIPLESTLRVSDGTIAVLRRIFFPASPLTAAQVRRRVPEVDAGLRALASRHGATFVELPGAWYGVDPIHLRRRAHGEAWGTILAPWTPATPAQVERGAIPLDLRLRVAVPDRRWLFGREQRGRQPAVVLDDGTAVSIY